MRLIFALPCSLKCLFLVDQCNNFVNTETEAARFEEKKAAAEKNCALFLEPLGNDGRINAIHPNGDNSSNESAQ